MGVAPAPKITLHYCDPQKTHPQTQRRFYSWGPRKPVKEQCVSLQKSQLGLDCICPLVIYYVPNEKKAGGSTAAVYRRIYNGRKVSSQRNHCEPAQERNGDGDQNDGKEQLPARWIPAVSFEFGRLV